MLSPFRFLARWAALLVGVYLVSAYAGYAYRQVWLVEWHGYAVATLGGLLLAAFVLSERKP